MSKEFNNTAILAAAFLLLFGVAELLYHKFNVKAEFTRKLVHFVTGLITLLFPLLINNHWYVLVMCLVFILILFASNQFDLLPSVNGIDRISYGSVSYPIAVYGCYLTYNYFNNNLVFFYLPVLVLAICDPLAALVGKHMPIGKFKVINDTKTMAGTAAFMISCFILSAAVLHFFNFYFQTYNMLFVALTIAAAAAIVEAISIKGFDNISIPLIVIAVLILFT